MRFVFGLFKYNLKKRVWEGVSSSSLLKLTEVLLAVLCGRNTLWRLTDVKVAGIATIDNVY